MRVSCLMVTQPGREALADAAIDDFMAQSWPDRELVIVTDGHADDMHEAWLERRHIWLLEDVHWPEFAGVSVVVARPPRGTLGALRNRALAVATGDAFLQWDDDDRYHRDRIELQASALRADPRVAGTCLTAQLYHFVAERAVYWVDWHNRRPRFKAVRIPGTLCVRASVVRDAGLRYPEAGPSASQGEDGAFLADVAGCGRVDELDPGIAWCYLRQYHGGNTWGRARFASNARWLGLDAAALAARRGVIERTFDHGWATPGPLTVMGKDRPAFTLDVQGRTRDASP